MRRFLFLALFLLTCRTRGTPPRSEPPPQEGPIFEKVWQNDLGERVNLPPATLYDGRFLVLTVSGKGVAVDLNGGSTEIFNVNEPPTAGPVVHGDSIIFGTFYGNFYVFDTAGNLLFKDSLISPIRGVAAGRHPVAVCDNGKVVEYNDTGKAWVRFAGDNVLVPPSLLSGNVIVATVSGNVLAYDSAGNLTWMVEDLGILPTSPSVYDSLVVVGFPDGRVEFLNPFGSTDVPLPSGVNGEITAADGWAYVSTSSGRVFKLTPGGEVHEMTVDSIRMPSSPTLTERGVVVVGGNGVLYLLSYEGGTLDTLSLDGGESWIDPLPMDSIVVVISEMGTIYGVKVDGAKPLTGWPVPRGNLYRSGTPTR